MKKKTQAELERIRVQCEKQLALMTGAHIGLMSNGAWGKTDYRYVVGVRGQIVQEYDYGVYCLFPAREMLEAVEKQLQLMGNEVESDIKL